MKLVGSELLITANVRGKLACFRPPCPCWQDHPSAHALSLVPAHPCRRAPCTAVKSPAYLVVEKDATVGGKATLQSANVSAGLRVGGTAKANALEVRYTAELGTDKRGALGALGTLGTLAGLVQSCQWDTHMRQAVQLQRRASHACAARRCRHPIQQRGAEGVGHGGRRLPRHCRLQQQPLPVYLGAHSRSIISLVSVTRWRSNAAAAPEGPHG